MLNFLLKLFSTKYQLQLNQVFQAINFCNSKLIFAAAADLLRHCPNFLYYVGTNCPQLESLTPWHQEVQNWAGQGRVNISSQVPTVSLSQSWKRTFVWFEVVSQSRRRLLLGTSPDWKWLLLLPHLRIYLLKTFLNMKALIATVNQEKALSVIDQLQISRKARLKLEFQAEFYPCLYNRRILAPAPPCGQIAGPWW